MQTRILWLLSILSALVLCFLPLTSLLGYESSAVMGIVLGLISMRLTATELESASRMQPFDSPLSWWLDRLGARLALTLPAAGILAANALRVKNCDPLGGAVYWVIIPMVSVLVGHALVFTLARFTNSPRWGWRLALGVVLLDTIWFFARLVIEPPITGVHLLFGYFAGSIYDEALSMPRPLLWYRAWCIAGSLAMVFAVELHARWRSGPSVRTMLWATACSVLATAGLTITAESHGYWLEREDIAEALGASVESAHFVFYYDPGEMNARQVQNMVEDHEFRYAELEAFLDERPTQTIGRPLRVFIYPNKATQHRLFGSRQTFVARPWTYEMHIRWDNVGDTAVAHELAHLFSAPFGGGPLALATDGGWMVHLGLVEGLALAADWPPDELTPHEAASAMRKLEIAPDLRQLFTPQGFWAQPSGKAYTLMGSFVRWLIDKHGIEKFKTVYRNGDWTGVYGQSTALLVGEWESFVDTLDIDESRLEMAHFKYSKKSIFGKTCARTLAELRRQARNAEGRGDYATALDLQQQILGFQKKDAEPGVDIAKLLVQLERFDEATDILDEMLARTGKRALKPKTVAEVEELRGDILWQAGKHEAAMSAYQNCRGFGLDDGERRRLTLKQIGLDHADEPIGTQVFRYLFDSSGKTQMLWSALAWTEVAPDDPLPRYLVGFQLSQSGLTEESLPYLEGPAGLLADTDLDEQRRLLLAKAVQKNGDYDTAERLWSELTQASSSRVRLLAVEGIDRTRFAQHKALTRHPQAP